MRDTSFVREGAEVAIINTGGWDGRVVGTSTIERVLKTQVVLANGRRFKMSDLHEHGRSYFHADQICAADDPRVKSYENAAESRAAKTTAHTAVDRWLRSREDRTRLRAAIEALEAYDALLKVEEAQYEAEMAEMGE